jgi:hypothetical protein
MSFEFSYRDLKKDMLSDKALALLSEFALIWHRNTGELINLDSDEALLKVFRNSKRSNDRRSRSIYLHLRAELSTKIESSLAHCDAMLADQLLSQVSRGRKCLFPNDEFVA